MTLAKTPRFARALAPLIAATALVSIPALAQDAAPQSAQPVVTPPSAPTVVIPPVVRTVPDGATTAAAPADEPAPRAAQRSTTRTTATRTTATRTAPRAAPARPTATAPATPASAPAAAPAKTTTMSTTSTNTTPAEPTAAPAAPTTTTTAQTTDTTSAAPATAQADTTTTSSSGVPTWAWIAGGIALLAIVLGAIAALRRRRPEDAYAEPAYVDEQYVEPAPVVEPVAAAPVAEPIAAAPRKEPEYLRREAEPVGEIEPTVATADDVDVSSAPAEEVAELTATAPVAERPWLEFAMRPVRAGTNVDEAVVEIELTIGNAGSVPAKDVRISTFLLSAAPEGTDMERLLVDPPADATTDPVTIQPGEGKRIDATLALLKSDMGENLPDSFRPIVVADARYTLEDGTEGRTSASFTVGVTPEDGGSLEPIELARASMHENVGAELHGEPQHA